MFFQNFCYSFFLGKFVPIIWSSSNPPKFHRGVHWYTLITILMFVFPEFLSLMCFEQIWSHNLKYFKLTEIWNKGRLRYAYFNWCLFFQNSYFWAYLVPKSDVLQINWYLVLAYIVTCLPWISMFSFSKFCQTCNFGQIWAKFNVLHID